MIIDRYSLPYRKAAGVVLFNRDGLVWLGKRLDYADEPAVPPQYRTSAWQMPQGGIDKHEKPKQAAIRELYEETNITSIEIITKTRDWLYYDIPDCLLAYTLKKKYRGQKQKWFAALFTGHDDEIDVINPGKGKYKPEFSDWRWEDINNIVDLAIDFKRDLYQEIVAQFAHLSKQKL